jgi:hypothetical protein
VISSVWDAYSIDCNFISIARKRLIGKSLFGGSSFDDVLRANKKCEIDFSFLAV